MADGLAAYLANAWVNTIRGGGNGTGYTAPAAITADLHLPRDPVRRDNDGTRRVSLKVACTSGAAAAGASALSNSPQWTKRRYLRNDYRHGVLGRHAHVSIFGTIDIFEDVGQHRHPDSD